MKKSLLKLLFLTFLMTMIFGMAVLANETETPENEEIIEETSYDTGVVSDSYTLYYNDTNTVQHVVTFSVSCYYNVAWDEGYPGIVTDAVFSDITNGTDNGSSCIISKIYVSAGQSNGSRFIYYKLGNVPNRYIKVTISCDEWGQASLWAEIVALTNPSWQ